MAGNLPIEFSISVTGETTGEEFKGVFKARPRLSHSMTLQRDQIRRDLLGVKGEEASVEAVNVATVFSTIWSHLTDAPGWWKESNRGLDLLDESPVAAVYDQILKLQREASVSLKKLGEEAERALKVEEAK
jgi:hypothetical protein